VITRAPDCPEHIYDFELPDAEYELTLNTCNAGLLSTDGVIDIAIGDEANAKGTCSTMRIAANPLSSGGVVIVAIIVAESMTFTFVRTGDIPVPLESMLTVDPLTKPEP
jgi:hypothetical protein